MRSPEWTALREDVAALHAAALAAADPAVAVGGVLASEGDIVEIAGERYRLGAHGRLRLLAVGKASRAMATAAIAALPGRIDAGVVVHPHDSLPAPREPPALPRDVLRIPASHPVPDDSSLRAGEAARRLVEGATPDDLLLVLLSGGASSLLELLPRGISLADLAHVTVALQRAGADIVELNTVRRALSEIKGGGLARLALPARVATLALSDVLGDRPDVIGSGPTVESPTGAREALGVLERYGLASQVPAIASRLASTIESDRSGSLEARPGRALFRIVASNRLAADAVARAASARGFRSLVMTTFLQGEAREAGRLIGGCASSAAAHGVPVAPPACLIFGGETTVTVRGEGRGGRNQELALGAALALASRERVAVLAFATDGVDGSSGAAGALASGATLARAAAAGLSPHRALAENDSGAFFRALGDQVPGGPTGTNVNDLAIALVYR